jgi:chromosome segregation ATPase
MNRLMRAAQEADAKRHAEMKKVEQSVLIEGETDHESASVSLHFSYESSHSAVMNQTIKNMQRMHGLDQHRIHELEERVRLLEHQAHVDFEREHRMIEEWEHAIEEENKMRMDIHKMQVAMSHHAEERKVSVKLSHEGKTEGGHWKEKYEHLHHDYDKVCHELKDYKCNKKKKAKKYKHDLHEITVKFEHLQSEHGQGDDKYKHLHLQLEAEIHEHKDFKHRHHAMKERYEKEIHELKVHIHEYKEYIEKDSKGDHDQHHKFEKLRAEYESVKHELHTITIEYHSCRDELHKIKEHHHGLEDKLHIALDDDDEDKAKIHHLRVKNGHLEKEIHQLKEDCHHWEDKF